MYGILRTNKIKLTSVTKRFQKHIQRQANYYHSNPDIDISKQNEDVVLIFSEDFKESIFEELNNHNITKQPRKNAVGLIDGVITASPCFFTNKDKDNIVDFFRQALPIIEREYGPTISAVIHFDEKTPHLHFCTVPILQNSEGTYKLSAKDVMGNRQEYIAKQDRFFDEYFKGYGLVRGQSVQETSRKHIDHNRFKAQKAKEEFNSISAQKDSLEGKIKTLEEVYQVIQDELLDMANSSELYEELLKKSIFKGEYKNVEEFQQRIMNAEEAAQIWEYMQEFYSESVEPYQYIDDDVAR